MMDGMNEKHRRSVRLQGHDYSQPGAYFVTICVQGQLSLLGEIVDGEMHLNAAGRMVKTVWSDLPHKFPFVCSDCFVIMPNHLHGILTLFMNLPENGYATQGKHTMEGDDMEEREYREGEGMKGEYKIRPYVAPDGRGESCIRPPAIPLSRIHPESNVRPSGTQPGSLGRVIQAFKSLTTVEYTRGVSQGWAPFPGSLWQRNYFEHIVRNEDELTAIREYIVNNPLKWALDRENPRRGDPCDRPQIVPDEWQV